MTSLHAAEGARRGGSAGLMQRRAARRFMVQVAQKYNRPIWLTELACPQAGKPAAALAEMRALLTMLDQQPRVARRARPTCASQASLATTHSIPFRAGHVAVSSALHAIPCWTRCRTEQRVCPTWQLGRPPRSARPRRYSWFAAHTQGTFLGPSASLMQNSYSFARLTNLGRLFASFGSTSGISSGAAPAEDLRSEQLAAVQARPARGPARAVRARVQAACVTMLSGVRFYVM
jgi:hypothetical protein